MVEARCDLFLVPPDDTKIYNKPWWKERLKSKCFRSLGPRGDKGHYLDVGSWMFMKGDLGGMDDFRNGFQQVSNGDIFKQREQVLGPSIISDTKNSSSTDFKVFEKHFPGGAVCSYKKTPLQKQRFFQFSQIEAGLKQHQLALYPHLEECLPTELFDEVVELLDPEMHSALNYGVFKNDAKEVTKSKDSVSVIEQALLTENVETSLLKGNEVQKFCNPYCWLPSVKEKEKDKKIIPEIHRRVSQNEDEDIHKVTTDFCHWVASLGGDNNNIEESTVTSLFASGYETKPALSVPIHVVELTNVPPELRTSRNKSAQSGTKSAQSITTVSREKDQPHQIGIDYTHSLMKFKYGAWYLKPKMWKVRPAMEPLYDPKEAKNKEMSESKKKSLALDYDLALMHGTKLFKDYINRRGTQKPEFLQHIDDICAAENMEEQEARSQMEHLKKKHVYATKHQSKKK